MLNSYVIKYIYSNLKNINNVYKFEFIDLEEYIEVTIHMKLTGVIFYIKYSLVDDDINSVTRNNITGSISVSNTNKKDNITSVKELVDKSFDAIFERLN